MSLVATSQSYKIHSEFNQKHDKHVLEHPIFYSDDIHVLMHKIQNQHRADAASLWKSAT